MADYYNKYADQINKRYDQSIGGIDKAQEADKQIADQKYQGYKNQASTNALMEQMKLRERMANMGLSNSGDNITGMLNINNSKNKAISQYNQDQQNYLSQLAQEKYKMQQALEQQRGSELLNAMKMADEWNYRDDKDQKEWDYRAGRDKLTDERYGKEWDYKLGRDKISDQRYADEWEYKKKMDSIARSRGGGGRSYSSSGYSQQGTAKDNVWNGFANAFNNGGVAGGTVWLNKNKADIIDATSKAEYDKMIDVAWKERQKKNDNDLRMRKTRLW